MAKSRDECTRNIVRTTGGIFLIYLTTLLYSYRVVPINWVIWLLFGVGFVLVILVFAYFQKYCSLKLSNINPIINTLMDFKELKSQYEKTENQDIKKEMESCEEILIKQIIAYLAPEKQFVLVTTHSYSGLIGTVEKSGIGQSHWICFSENKNSIPDKVLNLHTLQSVQSPIEVDQPTEEVQITSFSKNVSVVSKTTEQLFKVKSPDEYTRNIVKTAGGIFLIYFITLLYSYRLVSLSWAIWLLFAINLILVILIFDYFQQYHALKKGNIVPIKNTIRDLRELKGQYDKTENEDIKKEMEECWGKLVKQMAAYLEPEKQYIWVITKGYHGMIGQVEKSDKTNCVYFSSAKGVHIIRSQATSLDLSTIEYVKGIRDLKGFLKQKSWPKALFEKL